MSEGHAPSATPAPHFAFLDGIRGLAALYIVAYHCYFIELTASDLHKSFSAWQWLSIHWLGFGEEAMPVFMVLSGFGLMLSAMQPDGAVRRGLGAFLLRRARRILPAYYAALAISLLLVATIPAMNEINAELFKNSQSGNLTVSNVLSHLLLIEHAKYEWKFGIDPPIWGVAAIWWNNVFFGLILLPLWRKAGGIAVVVAFALSLLPHFFRHAGDSASPWLAGIMMLGMMAAAQSRRTVLPRAAWLGLAAIFFSACLYIGFLHDNWMWKNIYAMDISTGVATASLIVYCVRVKTERSGRLPLPFGILETRPMAKLGDIAYSLCLVHFPILWLLHVYLVKPLQAEPLTKMATLMASGIPAALLVAWGFHRLFDRKRA